MNDDLEIVISSDYRYEELVVEIYHQENFVARLSKDEGRNLAKIEFPASVPEAGEHIVKEMDLATFEKALELAKKELFK